MLGAFDRAPSPCTEQTLVCVSGYLARPSRAEYFVSQLRNGVLFCVHRRAAANVPRRIRDVSTKRKRCTSIALMFRRNRRAGVDLEKCRNVIANCSNKRCRETFGTVAVSNQSYSAPSPAGPPRTGDSLIAETFIPRLTYARAPAVVDDALPDTSSPIARTENPVR